MQQIEKWYFANKKPAKSQVVNKSILYVYKYLKKMEWKCLGKYKNSVVERVSSHYEYLLTY
jgi:hypothetical protein